ncbi:hypothetical protein NUW54_g7470 [Trametes sanguinea]|uniref:Uncharacterized protein n=1 Tax=Trametes sanguinea TaxID=158606 RepID=A0ACC1PN86_9APHY|nr:hypothetical protein NUW54_g7470 [Trametes sanguinea]
MSSSRTISFTNVVWGFALLVTTLTYAHAVTRQLREHNTRLQKEVERGKAERDKLMDEVKAERERAAEDAKSDVETQLASLRCDMESKVEELANLQAQVTMLRDSQSDRQSLEAGLFAKEKANLEAQLQEARASLQDLEVRHQETLTNLERVEEELKLAEDELSRNLSDSAIRSESEDRLRKELAQAKQQYEKEVASLQDQLKRLSDELTETSRLRDDADASRQAAEAELTRTKEQLESHLAEAATLWMLPLVCKLSSTSSSYPRRRDEGTSGSSRRHLR